MAEEKTDLQVSTQTETPSSVRLTSIPSTIETRLSAPLPPEKEMLASLRAKIVSHLKEPSTEPNISKELQEMPINDYIESLSNLWESGSARLIANHIDIIASRFENEVIRYSGKKGIKRFLALDVGQETRFAIWALAIDDSEIKVTPETLEKLYSYINSENRILRLHSVQYLDNLIYLDNRNRNANEEDYLNLLDRFHNDLVEKLVNPQSNTELEVAYWMIDLAWGSFPGELNQGLIKAMRRADDPKVIERVMSAFSNRIKMEEALKILRSEVKTHPDFKEKFDLIQTSLKLVPEGKIHEDLASLYEGLTFENYEPNEELLRDEVKLLIEQLQGAENILDAACGTGRHLKVLKKRFPRIIGYDFTEKHVKFIKESDPESTTIRADWHHLPFPNGYFDRVYMLGRSFTHNTTVEEAMECLRETDRILRKNGRALVDLPDPNTGLSKRERERLAKRVEELGINYYEQGTVIDSPDGLSFYNRLIFFPDQFRAIALLEGFKAEEIAKRDYLGPDGETINTNIYWELTKLGRELTDKEKEWAVKHVRTASPALHVTWI